MSKKNPDNDEPDDAPAPVAPAPSEKPKSEKPKPFFEPGQGSEPDPDQK